MSAVPIYLDNTATAVVAPCIERLLEVPPPIVRHFTARAGVVGPNSFGHDMRMNSHLRNTRVSYRT